MAELRKGKWYIERYDYHTGHRDYWNELTEEFVWYKRDATAYNTTYIAKAALSLLGFESNRDYKYKVEFHDN